MRPGHYLRHCLLCVLCSSYVFHVCRWKGCCSSPGRHTASQISVSWWCVRCLKLWRKKIRMLSHRTCLRWQRSSSALKVTHIHTKHTDDLLMTNSLSVCLSVCCQSWIFSYFIICAGLLWRCLWSRAWRRPSRAGSGCSPHAPGSKYRWCSRRVIDRYSSVMWNTELTPMCV